MNVEPPFNTTSTKILGDLAPGIAYLDIEACLGTRLNEHDIELSSLGITLLNGHLPVATPHSIRQASTSMLMSHLGMLLKHAKIP